MILLPSYLFTGGVRWKTNLEGFSGFRF
jgi:hypothetical protein